MRKSPVIDRGGIHEGEGSIAALALVLSLVSASVAGPNVTRLVVVEHATTYTGVDLTTNGDSTGDLLTFHNELFGETNTNVVGTNQGECVRIEVGVSWECRWVNFLEGGSITVEGPSSTPALRHSRSSGAGDYRAARGSMRLVPNEDGTKFTLSSASFWGSGPADGRTSRLRRLRR